MTRKECIQRLLSRLVIGDHGLRQLHDAAAFETMRETHIAYRRFKEPVDQKGAAEIVVKAQGAVLARALKKYGEVTNLPRPDPEYHAGFRKY